MPDAILVTLEGNSLERRAPKTADGSTGERFLLRLRFPPYMRVRAQRDFGSRVPQLRPNHVTPQPIRVLLSATRTSLAMRRGLRITRSASGRGRPDAFLFAAIIARRAAFGHAARADATGIVRAATSAVGSGAAAGATRAATCPIAAGPTSPTATAAAARLLSGAAVPARAAPLVVGTAIPAAGGCAAGAVHRRRRRPQATGSPP